jgi:hypothetical protein
VLRPRPPASLGDPGFGERQDGTQAEEEVTAIDQLRDPVQMCRGHINQEKQGPHAMPRRRLLIRLRHGRDEDAARL